LEEKQQADQVGASANKTLWRNYKQLRDLEEVALRLASILNFVYPIYDVLTS
jgi:hypothetical protein